MTDTDAIIDDPSELDALWRKALLRSGIAYLFSRLCVVVGAALIAAELRADENVRLANFPWSRWADPHYANKAIPGNALRPMLDVLTSWDGVWYLRLVRNGYPRHVPTGITYDDVQARAAFFPLYPMLVRAVDRVLPGGDTIAALFVNFVLGALAVWLVGLLARDLFGIDIGERAMLLFVMFPGSFVLSFAYTEALLLVLAAGCLLFLLRRQWLFAGILAGLGTATRPNGIALVAACAIAALIAIRERREWRSLIAVVLAPTGFVGFQLWINRHANEPWVWFRVQTEAWSEGTSWGYTALHRTAKAFISPLTSPTNVITAVSVLTLALLFWLMHRYRLPAPLVAYVMVVVLLMLIPNTVTARPRFVYTAFPLFISAAAWLQRKHRDWWTYIFASCAAGIVGLTALYGALGAIP